MSESDTGDHNNNEQSQVVSKKNEKDINEEVYVKCRLGVLFMQD